MNGCSFKDLSQLFSYPEVLPDKELLQRAGIRENIPDLVELQSQYVRLFINDVPEVPCPPYGSIYISGLCMGETTVAVRNIYRKYGFEAQDIPDHIAVELEFLHYLELYGKHEEMEMADFAFLLDHIKSWTPGFLEKVEKHDRSGFYSSIAQATRKMLVAIYGTNNNL